MKRVNSKKHPELKNLASSAHERSLRQEPGRAPWQSSFSRRVSARIGQPLSSDTGGASYA